MATPVITGVRTLLHTGTTYRARARIDAPSFLVTKDAIASRLEDEGFTALTVWKDPSELPADWPQDQRAAVVGGWPVFTAYVEGTWPKPDESRAIPEAVIALWVHKRPAGEQTPPISSGPEGSHPWAREIVRLAWSYNFHETPTEAVAQTVQAIALHESSYGFALKTPDGLPSHNWGGVQCATGWKRVDCLTAQTCPAGCFPHRDTDDKGVCYIACFRQYNEPLLGARDYIHTLCGVASRKSVRASMGYGNSTVIAREMRASGYFQAPAATYAAGIARRAREIATALHEPVFVEASNYLAAIAGLGLVGGATWYAVRRDRRLHVTT